MKDDSLIGTLGPNLTHALHGAVDYVVQQELKSGARKSVGGHEMQRLYRSMFRRKDSRYGSEYIYNSAALGQRFVVSRFVANDDWRLYMHPTPSVTKQNPRDPWWANQILGKISIGPFPSAAAAKKYLRDERHDAGPFKKERSRSSASEPWRDAYFGDNFVVEQRLPDSHTALAPRLSNPSANPRGEHVHCPNDLDANGCRMLQHVYESALKRGFSKSRAAQQAWGALENAGYRKVKGQWKAPRSNNPKAKLMR